MSDAIFVNGLVLHAYHGVMPHEGKVGQPFVLDLMLDIDLAEASRTDKLKNTVSYERLVKTVSEAFCARRYRLVEAAARRGRRRRARSLSAIRSIRITVRKPHAPIAATFDDVGVIITRARRGALDGLADIFMAEAFIALGGNIGDVRATFERAIACCVPRRGRAARRPFVGLSDTALGRDRAAAVHQCRHRGCHLAQPARPAEADDGL